MTMLRIAIFEEQLIVLRLAFDKAILTGCLFSEVRKMYMEIRVIEREMEAYKVTRGMK